VKVVEGGELDTSKYRQLYIDFNSVIHGCAREISEGGGPVIDKVEHESRIIKSCIDHVDHLIRMTKPSELVYIAIDGKPPRGKMHQQRQRRFMAASRTSEWDTNAVTPGTAFMRNLTASLQDEASHRSRDLPRWIVSGSDESGEGEQKILHHARSHAGRGCRAMIYGLDADLILLSITFLQQQVGSVLHIVREQEMRGPLQIVDTAEILRHVTDEMKIDANGPSAREFTALCALLGNDFVPALPGLRIRDGGIDAIVKAYRTVRGQGSGNLASEGPACLGGYNPSTLCAILEILSRNEGIAIADAERTHAEARIRALGKKNKNDESHATEMFPLLEGYDGISVRAAEPGWRPRYYRKLFGWGGTPRSVRSLCIEYIASLAWSASYMSHDGAHPGKCISEGWYYPHAYPPTALDMHMMLASISPQVLSREIEGMYAESDTVHTAGERYTESLGHHGSWQLLNVLPPQSMDLLDHKNIQTVTTDLELGCVHMFPTRFRLATYLKEKLHECVPMLPPVDSVRLLRALQQSNLA
jgi:5'-3' exonuclease